MCILFDYEEIKTVPQQMLSSSSLMLCDCLQDLKELPNGVASSNFQLNPEIQPLFSRNCGWLVECNQDSEQCATPPESYHIVPTGALEDDAKSRQPL